VGGLIIAALMSAVMSSADSILNSSTAIVVKDFYEHYITRSGTDPVKSLLIARISSVIIGSLGIILALLLPNVIDLLLLTYNLWGPGIILPVILGVFSQKESRVLNKRIFITMLVSTLATIGYMTTDYKEIIQPSVFGIGVSCITFVSLKTSSIIRRSFA
jgi:SSS family solute:Na+ symporter